ncbi:MAG: magnesium/cobalt transporter CorA [Candidatus Diapherotrites archaeon]|uniref:Magnesium transport protein CorA n=2 Tax=Candidatus Iainarchaeum sp. TaxID=3101447 RepID=A0A8T4L9D8_9ARCH|nr:magnesium/cobalt transporter CorA [Candidatus Diapherotrites archaeon]
MASRILGYNEEEVIELSLHQFLNERPRGYNYWLDLWDGAGDELEALDKALHLHHLAIEDATHGGHRPKVEDYGSHLFIIVNALVIESEKVKKSQASFFLGKDYVISVHKAEVNLEPVAERIRQKKPKILHSDASFLFYSLLDQVVDDYVPALEKLNERVVELEELAVNDYSKETLKKLFKFKRELYELERGMWPMEETLVNVVKAEYDEISSKTLPYFRDVQDHVIRDLELIEMYREVNNRAMEGYLLANANATNDVMKVLTVAVSITMVPNLLASIGGMNFPGLPEINFWYIMVTMALLTTLTYYWFKRVGWI